MFLFKVNYVEPVAKEGKCFREKVKKGKGVGDRKGNRGGGFAVVLPTSIACF